MLKIDFLGPLHITLNDEPLPRFRSRKVVALLLYLVRQQTPRSREHLADFLWDASSTGQALSNLRTALSYLRRELESYVVAEGDTLAFNRRRPHRLDGEELETALPSGATPVSLSAVGAGRLARALALYRGDFLADFQLRGAPRFAEWRLAEQERWRRRAADGFQLLGGYYETQAQYRSGIEIARRWVALDELDEAAHAQLIRLYALDGQRTAALQHFEQCAMLLEAELGVEPSENLRELARRIEAGRLKGHSTGAIPLFMEATDAPPLPTNLTTGDVAFVGREEELTRLDEELAAGKRLLTISGAGGMGKTRLALAAAARQLTAVAEDGREARFPQGIWFVDLAPVAQPAGLLPTIATTLGISLREGPQTPEEQLFHALRGRRMLLLLDNVEQLLDDQGTTTALIQSLLRRVPALSLMCTSRQPLELPEERLHAVGGLPVPVAGAVSPHHYPSVRLFLQAARRIQPGYALPAAALTHVREICALLEGMPLAIELAAAWVDGLPLPEIAAEIRGDPDFLTALDPRVPDRQRSIRTIFDHTWKRLSRREQDLFAALSIFRGGLTYEAAQSVGATRRALALLVKKSLLRFEAETGRYTIHELLRHFGAEKLSATPDREVDLRDAHARHFLTWLAEQREPLTGPQQARVAAAIGTDLENVRRAWRWAADSRRAEWLLPAVQVFNRHAIWRGHGLSAVQACRRADEAFAPGRTPVERHLLLRLRLYQAIYANLFGNVTAAEELLASVQTLLADPLLADRDTRLERASLLRERGKLERKRDLEAAADYYQKSIDLFLEAGDRWDATVTMAWQGDVLGRQGKQEARRRLTEKTLALQEAVGDLRGAGFSLTYLTAIDQSHGRFEAAEEKLQRVLENARTLDDQFAIAMALDNLGRLALLRGRYDEAQRHFEESLPIARRGGYYVQVKDNLLFLGRTALARQNFATAERHFREAERISRELGYRPTVVDALGYRGISRLRAGAIDQAHEIFEQASELAQTIHFESGIVRWGEMRGVAALHAGDVPAARSAALELGEDDRSTILSLMLLALEPAASRTSLVDLLPRARALQKKQIAYEWRVALGVAGVAALRAGRHEEGGALLFETAGAALSVRDGHALLYVLVGMALRHLAEGRKREAIRLGALLESQPLPAGSHWFAQLLAPVTSAAESLADDVRAATRATGRQRDLWETARSELRSRGR